jgi:hypothetical protein
MNHDLFEQTDSLLRDVVDPERKPKKPARWAGRMRKTAPPPPPKRCIKCRHPLSRQQRSMRSWWCDRCKDPDGYFPRLEKAGAAARDRCRVEYPPVDAEQLSLF